MSLDSYWAVIDDQLEKLKTARTAKDVVDLLQPPSSGDAFFGGGGGDVLPDEVLLFAGWRYVKFEAPYYWVMRARNGDLITYVEGDIYVGDTMLPGMGEL